MSSSSPSRGEPSGPDVPPWAEEVLERITDGFYAVDYDWRLTYVNGRTEELWGHLRDDLLGRVLWELFPDPESTEGYRMHQRAAREREPVFFETFSPNLGSWVDVRIYPGPSGLSVYFRDVTERRRIQESLRASEERLRLAMSVADIGTAEMHLAEGTYHFDARARDILGLEGAEVPAAKVDERLHPDDRAAFETLRSAAADPAVESDELHQTFRFGRPGGEPVWVTVHARVLFDGTGPDRRPVRAVGAFVDVTEQITAEEELREARDAAETARASAERASRSKDQFLSTMSHELRTPLAAVVGYVGLLQEEIPGPLNARQRDCLERIEASAHHQLGVVDEILTYSRIEAGEERVEMEEVDVAELTRETTEMLAGLFAAADLELEVRGVEDPVTVWTDGGKVRMVLTNLVGNALKYTEEGRVEVQVEDRESWVEVQVRDTGPGIPADHMDDIFRPFTQVDQSHTRPQGGTGLGLAICRRLAELMGATVAVDSVPGEGSVFTLRVPRRPEA